jgi:predicted DNA-binding transcriptional regulator AlpA
MARSGTMEKQKASAEPLAVDTPTAMRMLSLGRSSILNLADRGELPRLHFGRRVVFAVADVEALVERRRSASASDRRAAEAGIYRIRPGDPAA